MSKIVNTTKFIFLYDTLYIWDKTRLAKALSTLHQQKSSPVYVTQENQRQILTIAQLHHVGIIGPRDNRQDEDDWYPLDDLHAPPARTVFLAHSVHRVDGMHENACLPITALVNDTLFHGPLRHSGIAARPILSAKLPLYEFRVKRRMPSI